MRVLLIIFLLCSLCVHADMKGNLDRFSETMMNQDMQTVHEILLKTEKYDFYDYEYINIADFARKAIEYTDDENVRAAALNLLKEIKNNGLSDAEGEGIETDVIALYFPSYSRSFPKTRINELMNEEKSLGAVEIGENSRWEQLVSAYYAYFDSQSADEIKLLELKSYGFDFFMSRVTAPVKIYMPVKGRITSKYGPRKHPITGKPSFHNGVDFGAVANTPINAAESGTVIMVKSSTTGYGKHLKIDHGNGVVTLYAHCKTILVKTGDSVSAGQHIAGVGTTGSSTGNHLHFTMFLNDKHVDPMKYISE